ncbi:hypothetical protein [Microbacterium sp. KNMS]
MSEYSEIVQQVARFIQGRDARLYGAVIRGVAHPTWDEAELAQEEYLREADGIVKAFQVFGWGPTDASQPVTEEQEWEYGVRHVEVDGWVDTDPHPSRRSAMDDYSTCGMNCALVRRRPAGPWESVEADGETDG